MLAHHEPHPGVLGGGGGEIKPLHIEHDPHELGQDEQAISGLYGAHQLLQPGVSGGGGGDLASDPTHEPHEPQ